MLRTLDKSIRIKKYTVWFTSYCGGIFPYSTPVIAQCISMSSSTITMDTSDATHAHIMIKQSLTVYRKYHSLSRHVPMQMLSNANTIYQQYSTGKKRKKSKCTARFEPALFRPIHKSPSTRPPLLLLLAAVISTIL